MAKHQRDQSAAKASAYQRKHGISENSAIQKKAKIAGGMKRNVSAAWCGGETAYYQAGANMPAASAAWRWQSK